MSESAGTELVLVEKQPLDEWAEIINEVLPNRLGIHPAIFMDKAQQEAEQLDTMPTTSVSKALFALAAAGELHLQPNLIVRIPDTNSSRN